MRGARRATVLVVDDDESMRELLNVHLKSAGYEVQLAEDAIVAGYLIVERPPDLILVDVDMPYMNGIEFVAALRADSTLPRIPVVFLTALEDAAELASRKFGVEALTKPIAVDRLLEAVARHLPPKEPTPRRPSAALQ